MASDILKLGIPYEKLDDKEYPLRQSSSLRPKLEVIDQQDDYNVFPIVERNNNLFPNEHEEFNKRSPHIPSTNIHSLNKNHKFLSIGSLLDQSNDLKHKREDDVPHNFDQHMLHNIKKENSNGKESLTNADETLLNQNRYSLRDFNRDVLVNSLPSPVEILPFLHPDHPYHHIFRNNFHIKANIASNINHNPESILRTERSMTDEFSIASLRNENVNHRVEDEKHNNFGDIVDRHNSSFEEDKKSPTSNCSSFPRFDFCHKR